MRTNKVIGETRKFLLSNALTTLVIIIQVALLFIFRSLPPQVPLFYSQKWGEDRLVHPGELWLIPAICVTMVVITFVLYRIAAKDNLLLRVIFWTMPVFTSLMLITLANILLISS